MNAPQPCPPRRRPSRAQQLVEVTCDYFGLDQGVLRAHLRLGTCGCAGKNSCGCGRSPRSRPYCEARMLICYLLSEDLVMARARIGLLLHRDHSTILHNVQRCEQLLPVRHDLRWHLEQLRALLREQGIVRPRAGKG